MRFASPHQTVGEMVILTDRQIAVLLTCACVVVAQRFEAHQTCSPNPLVASRAVCSSVSQAARIYGPHNPTPPKSWNGPLDCQEDYCIYSNRAVSKPPWVILSTTAEAALSLESYFHIVPNEQPLSASEPYYFLKIYPRRPKREFLSQVGQDVTAVIDRNGFKIHTGRDNDAVRYARLNTLWDFSCTCEQCQLSSAEVEASDSRLKHIKALEETMGHPATSFPAGDLMVQAGAELVALYEQERLDVYIGCAYRRAALNYALFADQHNAQRFAQETLKGFRVARRQGADGS
ncbi:hypothetical protein N8I77_003737 [Diaporthe amygdali]|uniref:Uncharacterized protein n=1 Tax=Phomopsis amygdali TaxID=1214568 RepID=A0AAD9SIK9_PHOAM|nr:hypothetical protein N8I77_003737 [Diaporthe amygdali]